ncbi:MAG: hypothetical protein EOO20_11100 [Chryseobacterium sp.]|nr:MAG: hypothetical protein EOO20_11100 [Chryseobacterium sp.]
MNPKFLLSAIALLISLNLIAQERSAFRSGYLRLGINKLGNELDYSLSPKENIFDNRYGAGTGYVFEFGHIYYFKNRQNNTLLNFGLDWTILSLNYNKMEKWKDYAKASGAPENAIDGEAIAAAISSKLGPTLSINPIEKLIVDVRFQVAPTLRFFDFGYDESTSDSEGRYFYFINDNESFVDEDVDSESIKNRLAFGVATGFGITLRRKALGLSLDYMSGKVNSNYDAYDTKTGKTFGKEKTRANTMQFKLSFTL